MIQINIDKYEIETIQSFSWNLQKEWERQVEFGTNLL